MIKSSRTIARLTLSIPRFLFLANRFRKWGCGPRTLPPRRGLRPPVALDGKVVAPKS